MTIAEKRHAPVLNVEITPLDVEELLKTFRQVIEDGGQITVVGHNLHSVHLLHADPWFRSFYDRAEITLADGMPVLAALAVGELAAGRRPMGVSHRLGSTDWIGECAGLSCLRRMAVLGASTESNQRAVIALQEIMPEVELLGIPGDPWSESNLEAVADSIVGFGPQVLLIGMGMPLQERVAERLRELTAVPIIAAVGGAVDQISGVQSLAPRWLGRMGFEWLWRLLSDPRRMAYRYLAEPAQLALQLTRRAGR